MTLETGKSIVTVNSIDSISSWRIKTVPAIDDTEENHLQQAKLRYEYLKWLWHKFDDVDFLCKVEDHMNSGKKITGNGRTQIKEFHKSIAQELNFLQVLLGIDSLPFSEDVEWDNPSNRWL